MGYYAQKIHEDGRLGIASDSMIINGIKTERGARKRADAKFKGDKYRLSKGPDGMGKYDESQWKEVVAKKMKK